jgi:hypothetical protein
VDFDIQIVHGVEKVGQAAWDRLGRGQPFTSYRWYRFGEAVMDDSMPVYIILAQNGEPVARATSWVIRNEPQPISWQPVRAALLGRTAALAPIYLPFASVQFQRTHPARTTAARSCP